MGLLSFGLPWPLGPLRDLNLELRDESRVARSGGAFQMSDETTVKTWWEGSGNPLVFDTRRQSALNQALRAWELEEVAPLRYCWHSGTAGIDGLSLLDAPVATAMRGWLAVLALATLTLLIGLKLRWKRSEDDEDMPEDEEVQYGDPAEHDAAVRQLFFLVLAAVAVPIATLVLQQRQLLYRPEVSGRPRVASGVRSSPSAWGLQYESYFIRSRDGTKLHAWLLGLQKQGERRQPAILFFHSNAGDISQRLDFFKRCCRNLDASQKHCGLAE
eukprot:s843_g1.t1